MRKNTVEYLAQQEPPAAATAPTPPIEEQDDQPVAAQDSNAPVIEEPTPTKLGKKHSAKVAQATALPPAPASPNDASNDASTSDEDDAQAQARNPSAPRTAAILRHLQSPHRTPGDGFSDDSDYFPGMQHLSASTNGKSRLRASSRQRQQSKERKLARRQTEQSWKAESGMGSGRRADTLGDGDEEGTSGLDDAAKGKAAQSAQNEEEPILREALRGDMQVEKHAEEGATQGEGTIGKMEIEKLREEEGSVREEVY